MEIQQNPRVGSPTTTYNWQPLQGWFIKRFISPRFRFTSPGVIDRELLTEFFSKPHLDKFLPGIYLQVVCPVCATFIFLMDILITDLNSIRPVLPGYFICGRFTRLVPEQINLALWFIDFSNIKNM